MNSPSVDIATLLEGESALGLAQGTNLFVSREPTEPSNCVTLYDAGGGAPYLALGTKAESQYYYPQVMCRVRNTKYDVGYALAFDIFQFLHGTGQTVIGGTNYQLIKAVADPQLLNYDENNRAIIIINFNIQRR